MPSLPLLSPTPSMLLPQLSPATPRSPPPPPSPPLALPPPPSLLLEEPTLVPDATSPTPPEPSMLPRGRLRPTPTTTEDTTVSATGPTATVTATATMVRFCLDVLDLDATMLLTICPWIGPRQILNSLEVQNLESLHLALSMKSLPHGFGEVQYSTFGIYILPIPNLNFCCKFEMKCCIMTLYLQSLQSTF